MPPPSPSLRAHCVTRSSSKSSGPASAPAMGSPARRGRVGPESPEPRGPRFLGPQTPLLLCRFSGRVRRSHSWGCGDGAQQTACGTLGLRAPPPGGSSSAGPAPRDLSPSVSRAPRRWGQAGRGGAGTEGGKKSHILDFEDRREKNTGDMKQKFI